MNKAVQGAARLAVIFYAVLLLFTGCKDLFHDKEPEKPKEYTVTFDAAGGSPETQTVTVANGASFDSSDMPLEPSREGYIFSGWYTEGEGSEFSAGTPVNADIRVYAQWTIVPPGSYTVTFKLNNGTNTNWAARIVISGNTTDDFPSDPSRPGYTFAGWNTAAAGSGTPFTASTPVTANITIYAQWTAASPGSYTVAFNLNDGTSTTWAAKTVSSGTAIGTEDFPAGPSRPGYVFGGWNTQAEGGGNVFSASTAVNTGMTVYAQWTEIPAGVHTVIFKLNDGTETIWAAESVTVPGTPVTAFPVPPFRLRYTFTGWYTQADGGGSEFTESTAVNGNAIVYAQWIGETYTVTFKSNYGTNETLYTKTVTVPTTIITDFPADPDRTGYNFGSWNTASAGSGIPFTASTAVSGDITVYAQWNTYSYTVTFNNNGGDTAAVPAAKTVASPATNIGTLPVPPTRTGYTFAGWYTQTDGGGRQFTELTVVTGSMMVYAKWTGETYTVTFMSNYAPDTVLYTKEVTVPAKTIVDFPAAPSRSSYTFVGWNTQANGEGSGFTASTAVNGDITVYAKWTGETYTVTFKSNYGSNATLYTKTVIVPAITITDFPATPTRTGYNFGGWNTQADGGGSGFTALTTVDASIMVYAQWNTYSYTVNFDKNGGDTTAVPAAKTVASPATNIGALPVSPTRTGYIFGGWNTQANGGGNEFTATTTVSGNITVYAKWNTYSYTVNFDKNGGDTTAVPAAKTVASPATNIGALPVSPTRTGYIFEGWNTQANGGGNEFTATTTVSGSITVYAKWNTYSYTVNFDKNGGDTEAVPAAKTVASPATNIGTLPVSPTRTGYNFGGWYTQADGGGTSFTASTAVSGNITVHAKWNTYSYTVNFDKNGGDTAAVPAAKTVASPATNIGTLPVSPTRTGYIFGGWYTQANGGGSEFTASTAVSGNITVYAKWTGETYTVTFMSNYAPDTDLYTRTVTVPATTITDFPANPTRTGYNFGGWYTQADGGGTSFTTSTAVSGNITVHAKWNTYSYTVNFDKNSGDTEAVPAAKTVASPTTNIGTLPVAPTRTGYIFGGWNTQANGGGSEFTATTTVSGNITVYAKWTGETYTVTFMQNYVPDTDLYTRTVTVPATSIANFPAAPTRTGYNFGGWYTQADGGGSQFTASTAVSGSITVYAKWNTYSYTVSFDKNGGDTAAVPATKTVASPAINIGTLPVPPTRTGYIFGGWYTQANGGGSEFTASTAVSGNITVYAKWTGETYTVTFMSNYAPDTDLYTRTVTVPATTIASFPTAPTRTGYNFGGWNTQADGEGTSFIASTAVNGSITVYAKWNTYSYTVTFNKNGGDTEAVPATKTVASPATNVGTLPVAPTRTGSSFDSWNTQADGSGSVFTASTVVSGNITIYAKWTNTIITLNPDIGDGAFSQGNFTVYKSGGTGSQTVTITGSDFTNPRWLVDGEPRGIGASITINAADYGVGGHNLTLLISKNGVSWSKAISFTVAN